MDELPKTPPGMSQEVGPRGRGPWHVPSQRAAGASVIILRCGQEGSAVAAVVPCLREAWPCHPSPAVALCRRGTSAPAPATTSLGDLTRGACPLLHPCRRSCARLPPPAPLSTRSLAGLPARTFLSPPASRPCSCNSPPRHTFHSSPLTGGGDICIFLAATAGPENWPMVSEPKSTFCCC